MRLHIPHESLVKVLWACVALLTLAGIVSGITQVMLPEETRDGLLIKPAIRLFDPKGEGNIPAWFSSIDMLIAAFVLYTIGRSFSERRHRTATRWYALSAVFLVLSLDEAASIHEMGTTVMHKLFVLPPVLYYAWVIPGGLFVAFFVVANFRLLQGLPGRTRNLFVAAGCVFVLGALGLELIESYYDHQFGYTTVAFSLLSSLEEFLEMAGIVLFISALLDYMTHDLDAQLSDFSQTLRAGASSKRVRGRSVVGINKPLES